jgi:hypothetical protein
LIKADPARVGKAPIARAADQNEKTQKENEGRC